MKNKTITCIKAGYCFLQNNEENIFHIDNFSFIDAATYQYGNYYRLQH